MNVYTYIYIYIYVHRYISISILVWLVQSHQPQPAARPCPSPRGAPTFSARSLHCAASLDSAPWLSAKSSAARCQAASRGLLMALFFKWEN